MQSGLNFKTQFQFAECFVDVVNYFVICRKKAQKIVSWESNEKTFAINVSFIDCRLEILRIIFFYCIIFVSSCSLEGVARK